MIMSGPDDFALNANTFFENRGLFDIQSDASLVVPGDASGGNMRFLNTGTLRKSGGTGTTSLTHAGSGKAFLLDNSGTVEVDSGTLAILDPIVQVTGPTLAGGAWNVGAGATLTFPAGVAITTNKGSVTLGGPSASFAAISGLSSNAGALSLLAGSSLATTGSFTNSGVFTVGAGSSLTVNGSLTEVAGARLQIEIGGHPASNQFGQISVTGQANLAGALVVELAGGFGPTQGDAYSILNYASKQGSFAALSGLPPFFSANIGATSVQVNGLASASNLAVQSITLPASATVGQNASISFSVENTTTIPIDGSWTDSVYLSTSPTFGPDAVLFARVPHAGGLAAMATYTGTANGLVPGLVAGHYHVIVVADSAHQVPDTNQADNTLISSNAFAVETPALTIGSQTNGSVVNGQSLLYRIDVGSGAGDLVISTAVAASRAADFYLSYSSLPSSSSSLASWANQTALTGQLMISGTQAGAYYLLVVGREGALTPQNFSVTPRLAGFEIRGLTPNHGSNAGQTTITVTGSGLTPATTVNLVSGGTTRSATTVRFQDSNTLFATFDLTGLASGSFALNLVDGAQNTTQAAAFTVTSGNPGNVQYRLSGPEFIRPGFIGTVTIEYWNAGDTDVQAPLFTVDTDNGLLKLPDQPSFGGEMMDVLGINHDGPAGILPPGYRTQITLSVKPEQSGIHVATNITARIDTPLAGTFDWNEFKAQLKPESEPSDAWDAVYANFVAQMGTAFSQYLNVLSVDATYLSTLGEYTSDITRYISFELQKADDFGAITQRNELGLFGRGQPASFEIHALKESGGNVSILEAGELRRFILQPDGSFQPTLGDVGKLVSLPDGSYRLTEADGAVTAFHPNGTLDYLEDANHNRVTANYNNAGQLASLVSSSGDTLSLAYNGQGRVSQITDAVGRVTTYSYDASGQHLLSVANAAGTTNYTYVSGQGAASENAIASITLPNGTSQFFTYDAQGRLTHQNLDGGADPLDYGYDISGAFTVTDGAGAVTHYFPNDLGDIARVIDPLGHATSNSYDASDRVASVVDPAGNRFTITHDGNENPTSITDPVGSQIKLGFTSTFNNVSSLTDPNGGMTSYTYDAAGNVLSGTDAAGNSFQYSYDSRGNLIQTSSQAGRVVSSTYNSVGLLIRQDFSDGTFIAYGYDSHRNLATLTDATGTTTLSYDAGDRLTKVVYPDGRFVAYTYDAHGLRTQLATSDGYVLNYAYTAQAQLLTVKDGNNQTLVSYSYDNVGRIQTEQFGNGTSTSYTYDAAGHVLTIVNRASDNSVTSQIAYTYDALGEPITETTAAGTTTYGYDAAGQLVSAQLPGGRTVAYQYDAAGNRIAVNDSGTNTAYTANDMNQYANVGGATFAYDGDGNLLTRTDATGTTTYTYDAQNRLVGIAGPADSWSYEYDALGNRTATVHNGVRTEYLVDPSGQGNVIGAFDAGGSAVAHYAQGLSLIAQTAANGANNYYSFDALGNTTALTGADGSVLNTYSYLPFGVKLSSTGSASNPFTFVGQSGVMDDGSGLYFMRNRSYDPTLGRFTQEDPSGFGGGDTNLYRYASNNPTTFIDPSGLQGSPPSSNTLNQGPVIDGLRDGFYLNKPPSIPLPPRPNEPRSPSSDEIDPRSNVQKYLDRNAIHGRYHVGFGVYDVHNDVVASAQHLISLGFTPQEALKLSNKEFGKHTEVQIVSGDPNEMDGPGGAGPTNSVRNDATLGYTIRFENESDATAPAQIVVITEQLDANLDWNTFQLGSFSFGNYTVTAPAGVDNFKARVDARSTVGVYVDIAAGLNHATGVVTWTFTAIDPATGDMVTDALAGFLPPNQVSPEGDGFVSYSILPKANLTTGVQISAKATIVFDTNVPIDTGVHVNTIDAGAPSSTANVAKYVGSKFTVNWAGADDSGGAGIDHYDVYVSDNGGAFTPFLLDTTDASATFTGVIGHTYGFYSVATDGVGIMQPTPTAAQTTAQAILDTPNKQYIAAVYVDLLMRSVDLDGLAFWSSQLDDGAARNTIAAQLTHSAEYFKTNVIVPAYRQFLGRDADPGGIQYWTQQLQGGLTDEQMQAGFIASPEFFKNAGGTDKLWIDALYQALLDRQPDANGENYWIGQLHGHQSRAEVANDFTGSPEGLGDRVQQTYQRYLGRKAGQSEVDFWVGQYHQGKTNEDIVTGFLASDEYFKNHTS
jgi:RHS repeat-associated protein